MGVNTDIRHSADGSCFIAIRPVLLGSGIYKTSRYAEIKGVLIVAILLSGSYGYKYITPAALGSCSDETKINYDHTPGFSFRRSRLSQNMSLLLARFFGPECPCSLEYAMAHALGSSSTPKTL